MVCHILNLNNITNKPMELQKAIDILMNLHRHKLGKADKPTCTDAEINTARNVLMHYNEVQRLRSK